MVVAAGCALVKTDGPDTLSGVISPTERIKDLRDLAQNAATKNPTEKQMIAQQLAGDFQHEHDPLIRAQIVRTLAVYPGPLSDAVLHQAVKDPDNDVRTADCESWGQRGNADAAGTLAGILNSDTDHDVRIAAVRRWPMRTNRSPSWRWPAPWRTRTRQCRYCAVVSLREITGQDMGNDVNKWRDYCKDQPPQASTAEPFACRADLASLLASAKPQADDEASGKNILEGALVPGP